MSGVLISAICAYVMTGVFAFTFSAELNHDSEFALLNALVCALWLPALVGALAYLAIDAAIARSRRR